MIRYKLVTTKKGQVPLDKIRKGTLVLCKGEWVPAPKPERGNVKTLNLDWLPTTSFESKFVDDFGKVCLNTKPILNKFEDDNIGLSIMGYLCDEKERKCRGFAISDMDSISYWYPRLIKCTNQIPDISTLNHVHKWTFPDARIPKEWIMEENDLSERNLEYYLEGVFRRNFHWHSRDFVISGKINETCKIVFKLLNVQCERMDEANLFIANPLNVLNHIKDDYNKSKITEQAICLILRNRNFKEEPYKKIYFAKNIEESEDWILPGICPDINGMNPQI